MMVNNYIAMRNRGVIDASVLYEYAVGKGFKFSLHEFLHCLNYADINHIISTLDSAFGLTRLHDKNDNFIKIIE